MKNENKKTALRRGAVTPMRRTLVICLEAPSKTVFGDPRLIVKGQLRDLSELRWYPIHAYQLDSMKSHSRSLNDSHLVSTQITALEKILKRH